MNADERFMTLALEQARKALGRTSPNPAVGAVVVKGGKVVGAGYTSPPGGPHAEVRALNAAKEKAKGATLYSTLEPCNHFGKTPPCTEAIIAAGIKRVVYASIDPNPLVDGKGARRLKRAGLEVVSQVCRAEADELNRAFIKVMRSGLPYVTLKAAVSLDGKLAAAGGESKWITGELARARSHQLRDTVDAIVVGAGTVVADDPLLTTRAAAVKGRVPRTPLRVVIDPSGRTPATARLYQGDAKTLVAGRAPKDGVELLAVPSKGRELELVGLLEALKEKGVLHVLVEGGATTLTRFVRQGLADEAWVFVAPKLIGADGLSWLGELGVSRMAEAKKGTLVGVEQLGDDALLRVRFS